MTQTSQTRMEAETREAPAMAARLVARATGPLAELGARLRASPPRFVVTAGRGSSGAAGLYARYLIEQHLGLLTSSAAPSLSSIYGGRLDLRESLLLAVSQSGKSPDLIEYFRAAGNQGAMRVGMINAEGSPLSGAVDMTLPLEAGPEQSVAATKSCLAAMLLSFGLVAHWRNDADMIRAFEAAPDLLARALLEDWPTADAFMRGGQPLYVIGRGPGLAIAKEAALKLKETSSLFAEAHSSAEVRHGPFALAGPNLRVVVFAQRDAAWNGLNDLADAFRQAGSPTLFLSWREGDTQPALELLAMLARFYLLANATALQRGRSPDNPPRLTKITETR
jgi:glucosamine--fructose-6-phosphate aminotransferase (isomerizing)